MTDFLYLVLHLARKVTCYFRLFSSVLVSVLRTSTNVLSKSKSKNYVTWIANLTKLFLSVMIVDASYQPEIPTWYGPGSAELSTGTTLVAFEFADGVVMAADSRTSTGSFVAVRVTDKLTPYYGLQFWSDCRYPSNDRYCQKPVGVV